MHEIAQNFFLHEDSFVSRVNFARVTLLHESKKKSGKKVKKKTERKAKT